MLDDHTDTLEASIRNRSTITTYSLNTVQLSPSTGYVEGEIIFVDSSRLIFFEFLRQSDTHLEREKYRYHYMDADNQLLFRGVLSAFRHHFIRPGIIESEYSDVYGEAFDARHVADYDMIGTLNPEEAQKTLMNARRFVARAETYLSEAGYRW